MLLLLLSSIFTVKSSVFDSCILRLCDVFFDVMEQFQKRKDATFSAFYRSHQNARGKISAVKFVF